VQTAKIIFRDALNFEEPLQLQRRTIIMQNAAIFLVEANLGDEALPLRALKKNNIGNRIFVAGDGTEAPDFLFCTGQHAGRDPREIPQPLLLDLKLPRVDDLEVLACLRANKRTRLIPDVILAPSNE
jgi:CheY-like chemotaxis protein